MSAELHQLLEIYGAAPVECDGFVRLAHTALVKAGIEHSCMCGRLASSDGAKVSPIHFWIELADGRIVDYRARMWLGEVATVPHGIFDPSTFPDWLYQGALVDVPVANAALVAILMAQIPSFA